MGKKDDIILDLEDKNKRFKQDLVKVKGYHNTMIERLKKVENERSHLEKTNKRLKEQVDFLIGEKNKTKANNEQELKRLEEKKSTILDEIDKSQKKVLRLYSELIAHKTNEPTEDNPSIFCETDMVVPDNAKIKGVIKTLNNITIEDNVNIEGDVLAGQNIRIHDSCVINGFVKSNGSVTIGDRSKIQNDLSCGGDLTVGEGCRIKTIICGGNVKIGKDCKLKKISSNRSIEIGDDVQVEEGVQFVSGMMLGKNVFINGEIKRQEMKSGKDLTMMVTSPAPSTGKAIMPTLREIEGLTSWELVELCNLMAIDSQGRPDELRERLIQQSRGKKKVEKMVEEAPKEEEEVIEATIKAEKTEKKKKKSITQPLCSTCGSNLIYVSQYKRWYCRSCSKYE